MGVRDPDHRIKTGGTYGMIDDPIRLHSTIVFLLAFAMVAIEYNFSFTDVFDYLIIIQLFSFLLSFAMVTIECGLLFY